MRGHDRCPGTNVKECVEMDVEELELVHSKAHPPVGTQWPISS